MLTKTEGKGNIWIILISKKKKKKTEKVLLERSKSFSKILEMVEETLPCWNHFGNAIEAVLFGSILK